MRRGLHDRRDERLLVGVFDLAELVTGGHHHRSQFHHTVALGQTAIAIDIDELDANEARLTLEASKQRFNGGV